MLLAQAASVASRYAFGTDGVCLFGPAAFAAAFVATATYVERCDDQPAPDPACCFDCPVGPAPAEQ